MPATSESPSLLCGMHPAPRMNRLAGGWSYATWTNTAEFSEDTQDRLFAHLVTISSQAFGADMGPYWRDRRAGGFFGRVTRFCLLVDRGGEVVGWTGYHRLGLAGARCLYLDSSGVLPSVQGGGLIGRLQATMILRECLRCFPAPVHLLARTESPVVYRLLRNGCGPRNIWPSPYRPPSERISAIGSAAARWLDQADRFDPATLRVQGAYDNLEALYGDRPSCGEADLDAFFHRTLRPEDAFIVVARASVPSMSRAWLVRLGRTGRGGRGPDRSGPDRRGVAGTLRRPNSTP